jgi:signal transduction histidine kinase
MLHDFLLNNTDELTKRCRAKVADREGRNATEPQLQNGVPMFLEQLIRTLQVEQTGDPMDSRKISGPSGGGSAVSEVSVTAAQHGRALLTLGFTVDQVVHDYGDLCQSITDLAFERDAPFSVDEFRTLNRCLDNAIAEAVTEFSGQRDSDLAEQHATEANQKMGIFAHELRNLLHVSNLSFTAAKAGSLSLSGATGAVLERSLKSLGVLIDQSIAEVRKAQEGPQAASAFPLSEFILEIKAAGDLAAKIRGCRFLTSPVVPDLAIYGNRDLLYSAVWNLLQNAFKFTHVDTEVTLTAYSVGDRILIDVKDHCGGLIPGAAESMFAPFTQQGKDKSGLGLGLSIAEQCVLSNGGVLSVVNVAGSGCIFTIDLPRHDGPWL